MRIRNRMWCFQNWFSNLFLKPIRPRAFTRGEAAEREQACGSGWNVSYLFARARSVRRLILSAQQRRMNRSCSHNQPWHYSWVAHIMEVSPDHTLNIHGLLLQFKHRSSYCRLSAVDLVLRRPFSRVFVYSSPLQFARSHFAGNNKSDCQKWERA